MNDAKRDELASLYSDMYKDRHGVRPRHVDLRTVPLDELQRKIDDLESVPFLED
jgi:hypothetical protein